MFSCPDACPAPEPDYANYDFEKEQAAEAAHQEALAAWLKANGWAGPRTGKIVRFGVADGHAAYMVADGSRGFSLIHLPYGDAYQFMGIQHWTKKAILEQLDREEKLAALFSKKDAA